MLKWLFGLALGSPIGMAVAGGLALLVLSGVVAGFVHWKNSIYQAGELHERALWQQKVDEAAAKRDAERAAAQREQNELAAAQIKLEEELAAEQQEHSDDLARALAANAASNAPLGIVPDGLLAPFRALGADRAPAARPH